MQYEKTASGANSDRISGLSAENLSGGETGQRVSGTSSADQ